MANERSLHYYFLHLDYTKISVARELQGWTKKELAERIGKTPSSITQFENGKITPSLEVFRDIADALSVHYSFLSTESQQLPQVSLGKCHFRANRRVPQTARQRALRYASQVYSIYSYLADRGIAFPELRLPRYEINISERQIEAFSMRFRQDNDLGQQPIQNMAKLVEGLGIRIILLPESKLTLDGFATWFNGQPCIMVDSISSASRMQFDYAHELAHLLFDEENSPDDVLLERRANRFASSFLMPKEAFTADCPPKYSSRLYKSVKQQWYVSIAAILYRARALGILSESAYKSAQIARARMGVRREEEGEFEHPYPTLLNLAMALICDEIHLDEMALDLGLTTIQLETMLITQKVAPEIIAKMSPAKHRARIFDFSVCKKAKN